MKASPEDHSIHHPHRALRCVALMALSIVLVAPALRAQTVFDWNGGTGNWFIGANRSTSAVPDFASYAAGRKPSVAKCHAGVMPRRNIS